MQMTSSRMASLTGSSAESSVASSMSSGASSGSRRGTKSWCSGKLSAEELRSAGSQSTGITRAQTSRYTSASTRRMCSCWCRSLKRSTYAAAERFEELVLVRCAIVPPLNLS